MPLHYHPEPGTILVCDFRGFEAPEMVKRRPVVVVSPRLRRREGLLTIVPLSTTEPKRVEPYHFKLHLSPALPKPFDSPVAWVKADMIYTVSMDRLSLPFSGKDASGKRIYDIRVVEPSDLLKIRGGILHAIGLTRLTDCL